jgi:GMP synthase-like glutamine amidotransferase
LPRFLGAQSHHALPVGKSWLKLILIASDESSPAEPVNAFEFHRDEVISVPKDAFVFLSDSSKSIQGFRYGNVLGFQPHIEATPERAASVFGPYYEPQPPWRTLELHPVLIHYLQNDWSLIEAAKETMSKPLSHTKFCALSAHFLLEDS